MNYENKEVLENLNIHKSWYELFDKELNNSLEKVINYLQDSNFTPELDIIFNTFLIPVSKVKVVIVGQDPYPQPNYATGLAFAVPTQDHDRPSLKIIRNELFRCYGDITIDVNLDRTLNSWLNQGIMLLNASLTCEMYKSNTHSKIWRPFIIEVFKYLKDKNIVYALLGSKAQSFKKYINGQVIETYHPMYDIYKKNNYFVGSDIFSDINLKLKETNIDWIS